MLSPVWERQTRMRRVGEGRGHPVPGPRPRVAGVACLGQRAVEEGRAGAVEASLVITGLCLGVSGGQAVVVGGVAELGGRAAPQEGIPTRLRAP